MVGREIVFSDVRCGVVVSDVRLCTYKYNGDFWFELLELGYPARLDVDERVSVCCGETHDEHVCLRVGQSPQPVVGFLGRDRVVN